MKAICLGCCKILKDPESIRRGYGPICWAKLIAAEAHQQTLNFQDLSNSKSGLETTTRPAPEKR